MKFVLLELNHQYVYLLKQNKTNIFYLITALVCMNACAYYTMTKKVTKITETFTV